MDNIDLKNRSFSNLTKNVLVLMSLVGFLIFNPLKIQSQTLDLGTLEQQFAEKFAPILHKHSQERQQGLANFSDIVASHLFEELSYNL